MKERYAPIVLFVYNRPEHTRKTVESLARNGLAKESILYIFSDAPKNSDAFENVKKVRRYISKLPSKKWFHDIRIEEAPLNRGLADAIITGVTKVMHEHGKAIVLEDDLLCAPDFLDFMNSALNFFEADQKIGSISGYSPIQTMPEGYSKDIWIASRSSSLGWATWADRWFEIKWQIDDFEDFRKDKVARKKFDACGSDRFDRLRRQIEIGANSWSIRFGYWQSRSDRYTVFPSHTRIQHIGWDGSGVHGTYHGPLDTHIVEYALPFTLENVSEDPKIIRTLKMLYSGSLTGRFARYLRNNGFERLEAFLRSMLRKKR